MHHLGDGVAQDYKLHQQRTAVTFPSLSACVSHPAIYWFIPQLHQMQQLTARLINRFSVIKLRWQYALPLHPGGSAACLAALALLMIPDYSCSQWAAGARDCCDP